MNVNNQLSSSVVATAVWASATRTLTSVAAIIAPTHQKNQTIAASTTVTIGGTVGQSWQIGIGFTGTAGGVFVKFSDGTQDYIIASTTATSSAAPSITMDSSVFVHIVNADGASSAKYAYTARQYT